MPLWDGRFSASPAEDMVRFSACLDVDRKMWREDIQGSRAHVLMLGKVGLLTSVEVHQLQRGLDQVHEELDSGAFVPGEEHEDIHMAVEARLTEIVGPVGGRLHTARSRNDQVATDVRLWLRHRLGDLDEALTELVRALVGRVQGDGQALLPGYTHLQRGQPILLGHHLLAHAWMVLRDRERVRAARVRSDQHCPLGACAMAGTPHPIDPHETAEILGFAGPFENAMDAVSARDHLCEAVSACAITMTHLSRQAEELVLWSSAEFAFVRLDDGYTTGSSIMPQKRNPDAAELVRGKAGRVIGALTALLTLVKGLPLAYNRDLQEDRAALFDAVDTTVACTRILAGTWKTLTVRANRFEDELRGDFSLATELADWLVNRGVPFRDAHHVAGRVVARCEAEGKKLCDLSDDDLASHHPELHGAGSWLDPRAAAERRTSHGGTASAEIRRQVDAILPLLS